MRVLQSANTYYTSFDIEAGDPWIINNNLPFTNCGLADTGQGIGLSALFGIMLATATITTVIASRRSFQAK